LPPGKIRSDERLQGGDAKERVQGAGFRLELVKRPSIQKTEPRTLNAMLTPAQQLRSVALRYQRPLAAGAATGFARRRSGHGVTAQRRIRPEADPIKATASRISRRGRLEAVLLLAREPLSLRKLAQSANLTDGTEARTLLTELRQCYDARGCAFGVEQLAGGYQLMTRPKFAPWLRPLAPAEQEIRLSPPTLETLSVVAYRQPVLRSEVEAIRGVACGEILRQLMDRDLLRIVGRSEELGRPLWYGTTKRFLHVFGLSNLEQLPMAAELRRRATEVENSETPADLSSCDAAAKPVAENLTPVANNIKAA
jgi:segregation and condensation protein B